MTPRSWSSFSRRRRRPPRRFLIRSLRAPIAILLLTSCTSQFINSRVNDLSCDFARACAEDDDPELVWQAAPFALKTIDALIIRSPDDRNLRLAAARGYTQYAFGSLAEDADRLESSDHDRAVALRARSRRLLLRARDHGMLGLSGTHPGFQEALRGDAGGALKTLAASDAPLLYWTACAWGAAIAISKDDPELMADLFVVEAMMRRVIELDERYDSGAAHEFMIALEGARGGNGRSRAAAEEHYRRASDISRGRRLSLFVTWAESVLLPEQRREDFRRELERVTNVTSHAADERTLANVIAKRRAQWLLDRTDELFLEQ